MRHAFRLLLILLLCGAAQLKAQSFSYLYIQGDKKTPFYVKLEGEMQPRYGKNYCILPELAPGPIHLEILFQQNAYPAQQFTVLIPENSSRGFLLTQKEGVFSLYDLQQQFYLPAGNKEEDDHLPALPVAYTPPPVAAVTTDAAEDDSVPVIATPKEEPPVAVAKPVKKARKEPVKQTQELKKEGSDEPEFLPDIQLPNNHQAVAADPSTTITTTTDRPALAPTFRNSDCPAALDDVAFERIYKTMIAKPTDEERVEYIDGQMDQCYQTWQARTLGNMLTGDAARFTFLKKVYPRITDQASFSLLDDMFRSEVWKTQFQQLIHP